ncbi:unnamed protein product [Citrullus colocynthis]|uniref:Uncharacterized protein n=1 Tax=Citrullus colocynthis TaxID=252529 RepID=A0ABP0XR62_9ROSI
MLSNDFGYFIGNAPRRTEGVLQECGPSKVRPSMSSIRRGDIIMQPSPSLSIEAEPYRRGIWLDLLTFPTCSPQNLKLAVGGNGIELKLDGGLADDGGIEMDDGGCIKLDGGGGLNLGLDSGDGGRLDGGGGLQLDSGGGGGLQLNGGDSGGIGWDGGGGGLGVINVIVPIFMVKFIRTTTMVISGRLHLAQSAFHPRHSFVKDLNVVYTLSPCSLRWWCNDGGWWICNGDLELDDGVLV